jgi:(1->4)-alpha-D-glucan 1-alpha-D-glucosylmutase
MRDPMNEVEVLFERCRAELTRTRHATYRLQLGPSLRFDDVGALAPYLSALGISEAYLSPCFKCGPGSAHGYDITDHNAFNPEIGSLQSFHRMAEALGEHGLGVILDVVPNHMSVAGDSNAWWLDVLENGPSSPCASFFDIEWNPVRAELQNKVLLPVLPDQYGTVLESQQLQLEASEGAFVVRCAGARLPLDPKQYPQILSHRLDVLAERLGPDDPHLMELRSILTALEHLPAQTDLNAPRIDERLREKEIIKRRLAALLKESVEIREFTDDNLRAFNGTPGEPSSFDLLDRLLSAQAYRLADWRVAGDEVNYRRFFDVNHLAAIRMERPEVFAATHKLVLSLVADGTVTGLRVDHPDGLYGPGEYFRRLQESALVETARRLFPDLDDAQAAALVQHYRALVSIHPIPAAGRPLWVAAEKILGPDEPLPDWWPVSGSTGYDFLASLNGLFVDRKAWRQMTAIYTRFTGETAAMADIAFAAKRLMMQVSMSSEINQLGRHLDQISQRNRHSRDFTLHSLIRALREVIACFPVYRTYVGDAGFEVSARDYRYIERAVAEAKRRNPTVNVSIFDFVHDTLLLRYPPWAGEAERAERRHFVMRFQQTTGPVTAKGVEDTALYSYHRLVSLNEVGADPARYGEPQEAFHEKNAQRLLRWPDSLICTSTHDTKRGEDVRARINVLSEVPEAWAAHVRHWRMIGRRCKSMVDGHPAPDRNDEYLLYQTLVGAWPTEEDPASLESFTARIGQYVDKATKEAKRHTSWINPNPAYDAATQQFVARLLTPGGPFLDAFRPFQRQVAFHGMINSLAQTALKIASPGIPDVYQGSELWDLSLVDPDNRRPVDFAHRQGLLQQLLARIPAEKTDLSELCAELLASWTDGRVKLFLTQRALTWRRRHPRLCSAGAYQALSGGGAHAQHVIGFARLDEPDGAIVAVPRLTARLTGFAGTLPLGADVWADTWLSLGDCSLAGVYRDCFSGQRVVTEARDGGPALAAGSLFASFPAALLEREGTSR